MYIIDENNSKIIKKELLKLLKVLKTAENPNLRNDLYSKCIWLSFSLKNKRLEKQFNYLLEKETIKIEPLPW